ncbi:MAG TPA: DUF1549 domain-containing protein, partial [Gemmataceae bacterium]|nr:DUF1549 domain-containing protein [Gemmataceae bacterium]
MFRAAPMLLAIFGVLAPAATAGPPKVDYNFQIRPLLADRCYACHGPDAHQRKAHLRLDMAASVKEKGVIVPGKPEQSEVYRRISAHDRDQMPPRKSNLRLNKDEIELIRRWIAEGAEFKPHWAFVPLPDHVRVPAVANKHWPTNPIDNFVLARLEREGLKPSQPAPRTDWIRRVTFDLTGLPPTPAEVDAFLADHSPRAFENVVDRLLASKHFGERLAMDWL